MRFPRSQVTFALWLLWVFASVCLVVYGRTLQRIDSANALHSDGATARATEALRELREDFRNRPWLHALLPRERDRVAHNYLRLLYLQGDYDRVIEEGEGALLEPGGPAPLVRFWLGNAYYRNAIADDGSPKQDEARAWLRRAAEQYRQLIADGSVDWDVKYNYELVQTLLRRVDQQSEEDFFDILRPQDKTGPQPPPPSSGRIG